MSGISIVVDSAADLPPDLARELEVTVVPLVVTFGDRSFEDTALSRDEFWRLADAGPAPGTSQPPVGAFYQAFARLVAAGRQVLCLTLTAHHSGTYSSAWAAAQEFGDAVRVVDSRSLSMGLGWLAMQAVRLARQGDALEQIQSQVEALRERVHVFIQLDTLENLRRGGRAARLMPFIERLARNLHLKPILNAPDGELKLLGVARSMSKGMQRMTRDVAHLGPLQALSVMHIRAPQLAEEFAALLAEVTHLPRTAIAIGEAGAALACHGGRGLVAAGAVTATA
jgi:DegV family protein with EDD domain